MGHQVLGQAFGGKTFKLKFGHHGGNHPIRYIPTGKDTHLHALFVAVVYTVEHGSLYKVCEALSTGYRAH